MRKLIVGVVLAFVGVCGASADEVVPIAPCRLLDTRPSGIPLAANASAGATARGLCGIPSDATALVVNLTVVNPAGAGYLQAYGTSSPPATAVLTYNAGQTVTAGAQVALSTDDPSTSEYDLPAWDLRLLTSQAAHVVVDVTGYLTRLPTKDFQGTVLEITANLFPDAIVWKLAGERLPVVCFAPWINPNDCGVQPISDEVCGTAHLEHYAAGPYAAGPHLVVDSLEACP